MATSEANYETSTSISTPKGKRGLYRCRQTVYSRRLKTKVRENQLNVTDVEHPFTTADVDHLSNAANVDEYSGDSNTSYPKLFPGSVLTSRSSSPWLKLIIADTFEIIPVDFTEDTISGASVSQIQ